MELTRSGERIESPGAGKPTSGNWKNPAVAKDGWTWHGCEDTGDYPGPDKCQMCLKERPRVLHMVSHPDHGTWKVGCVCAAWMTDDPRPEAAERRIQNEARKRKRDERRAIARDLSGQWKEAGSSWRLRCGAGIATVFPNGGVYQIRWARVGENVYFDSAGYQSAELAKNAVEKAMVDWVVSKKK